MSDKQSIAPPTWAVCVITHEVMRLPYVTTGGISFEGDAIRRALEQRPNCPTTNKPCQPHQLRFNRNLFDAINAWRTLNNERVVEYVSDADEPELDLEDTDAFIDFVKKGDINMVRRYVAGGVDIMCTTGDRKWTPLLIAADAGNIEIVEILLEKMIENGTTNVKGTTGETALYLAAQGGHFEIAKKLIPHVDVNAATEEGRTALHQACQAGCLPLVQLLVESGVKLTARESAPTPLMLAIAKQSIEIIRYLLDDCGVDVNETSDDGDTALHQACQIEDGHEYVQVLLDRGANVHAKRENGIAPVHLAAIRGGLQTMKLLKAHDTTFPSMGSGSVLLMAVAGGNIELAHYLLTKCDVDVNEVAVDDGDTALHAACQKSDRAIVELLLGHGANVHAKRKNANMPIHLAAASGNTYVVEQSLAKGVDVDVVGRDVTPLLMACQEGHIDIIELLITNGADVNYQDPKMMRSPLHMAAHNEHVDCMRALLAAGANVNALTKKKATALRMAAAKDNVDCVRELIEAGADADIADADGDLPHQLTRSREIVTLCGRDPDTDMRERSNGGDLMELMQRMRRTRQRLSRDGRSGDDEMPECATQ